MSVEYEKFPVLFSEKLQKSRIAEIKERTV